MRRDLRWRLKLYKEEQCHYLTEICVRFSAVAQWSFRGGTRGNAVPIVKIPLERMGTAFPLLSYGENAWERCCIVTKLHNTFHFSPITPIHYS